MCGEEELVDTKVDRIRIVEAEEGEIKEAEKRGSGVTVRSTGRKQ